MLVKLVLYKMRIKYRLINYVGYGIEIEVKNTHKQLKFLAALFKYRLRHYIRNPYLGYFGRLLVPAGIHVINHINYTVTKNCTINITNSMQNATLCFI